MVAAAPEEALVSVGGPEDVLVAEDDEESHHQQEGRSIVLARPPKTAVSSSSSTSRPSSTVARHARRAEAARARGFATRALVNAALTVSPAHGHAFFGAASGGLLPGRRCVGCEALVWVSTSVVRCHLCDATAHRGCLAALAARRACPGAPSVTTTPTTTQGPPSMSLSALKYVAARRARDASAVGRAVSDAVERRLGYCRQPDEAGTLRERAVRETLQSAELAKLRATADGAPADAVLLYTSTAPPPAGDVTAPEQKSTQSTSRRVGLWAGATAAGTVAGSVVGGAVGGPAGAVLGAKVAQTSVNVGAVALGAAVGYRNRGLLLRGLNGSNANDHDDATETTTTEDDRQRAARRCAERATRRAAAEAADARGNEEPWAAATAAATARADLEGLAHAVHPTSSDRELLAALVGDGAALGTLADRVSAFAALALGATSSTTPRRPAVVYTHLTAAFVDQCSSSGSPAALALELSRRSCVEVVAYLPAIAETAEALVAARRQVDRCVFGSEDVYGVVMAEFVDASSDRALTAACDDVCIDGFSHKPSRAAFQRAVEHLRSLPSVRAPLDKLDALVDVVAALADCGNGAAGRRDDEDRADVQVQDDDDDRRAAGPPEVEHTKSARAADHRGSNAETTGVTADVLLPLAVDAVRAARVPHLHAHLAYVDHLCHPSDCLGRHGYALTTLACAVAVLCRGHRSKDSGSALRGAPS